MPHDYFARVTHSFEALRSLISLWALQCEKMAVYEHVGTETEKVHCHLVILGSRVCKKQLRNIGSTCVPLKGNEYCSFKECVTWETPMTYMTKGELDPKYLKGFTMEECTAARDRWVEPNPSISKDRAVYNDCFYIDNQWWEPNDVRCKKLHTHYPEMVRMAPQSVVQHAPMCELCKFDMIKKKAWSYVFNKFEVWNMKSMNMYKMLVMTYCMSQSFPIPVESHWGKWL